MLISISLSLAVLFLLQVGYLFARFTSNKDSDHMFYKGKRLILQT